MTRYYLRLTGKQSGEVIDVTWMDFHTQQAAEDWANKHQNAHTDPRLAGAARQTTWEVVDRGPWWRRIWKRQQ